MSVLLFSDSELQEKVKLDAEREKLERLQELYSEQKTQLDNCPESMREQLQQQLKRVSSKQECTTCLVCLFFAIKFCLSVTYHFTFAQVLVFRSLKIDICMLTVCMVQCQSVEKFHVRLLSLVYNAKMFLGIFWVTKEKLFLTCNYHQDCSI